MAYPIADATNISSPPSIGKPGGGGGGGGPCANTWEQDTSTMQKNNMNGVFFFKLFNLNKC